MIDHIYIPTLGRSNNQITFDNMSKARTIYYNFSGATKRRTLI